MGKDRYHGVVTLVERATGYAIIKTIEALTAENVATVARHAIGRHKSKFVTLTLDNGTEFHNDGQIEVAGERLKREPQRPSPAVPAEGYVGEASHPGRMQPDRHATERQTAEATRVEDTEGGL